MMSQNRGVIGLHLGRMTGQKELLAAGMKQILQWWAQGQIEPIVGGTFPLEMAGQAQEFIQARKNIGKVILTP